MKLLTTIVTTALLTTNGYAADNGMVKGRWYSVPYDLTIDFEDNPVDWGKYARDVDKWRDTFKDSKDGKASTLRTMVNRSPGCLLLEGKGDHKDVWSVIYEKKSTKGSKQGYVNKYHKITGFSDNKTRSADGDRKTAYDIIYQQCGVIYGTAGKSCIDIYGISLCNPF